MSKRVKDIQVEACSCANCRSACQLKPGWFKPEQIEPLAKVLGLTIIELFKQHLQIDWWVSSPNVYVLSPRLKGENGGTMFPGNPKGQCHWYESGKCVIHTLGKPFECQALGHTKDGNYICADHSKTAAAWHGIKHQKMIADLYGEEPEANDYEISSIFSWLEDL